jgi:hypothetical protein
VAISGAGGEQARGEQARGGRRWRAGRAGGDFRSSELGGQAGARDPCQAPSPELGGRAGRRSGTAGGGGDFRSSGTAARGRSEN